MDYFLENFYKVQLRYANYTLNSLAWMFKNNLAWAPKEGDALTVDDLFKGRMIGKDFEINKGVFKFLILLTEATTQPGQLGKNSTEVVFKTAYGMPLPKEEPAKFNRQLANLHQLFYTETEYLLHPEWHFAGTPISSIFPFKNKNVGEYALPLLKKIGRLCFTASLRGIEFGSSIDLEKFQKVLTREDAKSLEELPFIATIAGGFKVKTTIESAAKEDEIEYIIKYGKSSRTKVIKEEIKLTKEWETPNGPADALAYIFKNIFELSGIKITCEIIPPPGIEMEKIEQIMDLDEFMQAMESLESVGIFNLVFVIAGNVLSGVGLSIDTCISLAIQIQNNELNTPNGYQGYVNTILGGINTTMGLSFDPNFFNFYPSALIRPLFDDNIIPSIEKNTMMIFPMRESTQRSLQVNYSLANFIWLDLIEDFKEDPKIRSQLAEMLELAGSSTHALKRGDYKTIVKNINRNLEIRNEWCLKWVNLMLNAKEVIENKKDRKNIPFCAFAYYHKVFNPHNPQYKNYQLIRDLLENIGEKELRITSVYTLGPIGKLISEAQKNGIAIWVAGAGGPKAMSFAFSEQGQEHLKKFLVEQGLIDLTTTKTPNKKDNYFIPFIVGKEPFQFIAGEEISPENLSPQKPIKVIYAPDINFWEILYRLPYSVLSGRRPLLVYDPVVLMPEKDGERSLGHLNRSTDVKQEIPNAPLIKKTKEGFVVEFPDLSENKQNEPIAKFGLGWIVERKDLVWGARIIAEFFNKISSFLEDTIEESKQKFIAYVKRHQKLGSLVPKLRLRKLSEISRSL